MYNIYFLNQVLTLADKPQAKSPMESKFFSDPSALTQWVNRWIEDENKIDTLLYGYPSQEMLNHLIKHFHFIEAAGGVVRNKTNNLLFIKRWGIWDLPKGKREKGEEIKNCALREVNEETGVSSLQIIEPLSVSYHFYQHKKKIVLKKTYWFLMETDFKGTPVPQEQEDITRAVWLDKAACEQALSESYRSLRESLMNSICKLI